MKPLECELVDFIQEHCDYLTINEDDYWYLFNLCTEREKLTVKSQIETIKNSIKILQEIQDDCYSR